MSSGPNPFGDIPPSNPYATPNPFAPSQPRQTYPAGAVKNYLVESILSLICCGGLFAIPAIVYASQVNGKLAVGDYAGAVQASNNAFRWLMIAVVMGFVCGGIGMAINIAGVMNAQH